MSFPLHVTFSYKTFWCFFFLVTYMKTLENNYSNNTTIPSAVSRATYPAHHVGSPCGCVGGKSAGESVLLLENRMAAGRRGVTSERWAEEERWKVGDGCCALGSEPEVGFVFHHVSDEREDEARRERTREFPSELLALVTQRQTGPNMMTDLSRVSQKRRKTGRSRWRLWRLSSRTVTSHFCTLRSVFASSYFK